MTDKEIIKALECCKVEFENCEKCPYGGVDCLTEKGESLVMRDALDLINRQQAEIEMLKDDFESKVLIQVEANDGKRIYPTLKAAKNALEKQIPKKPIIKKCVKVNAFMIHCPSCELVLQSDSPCCRYCGQALDWSDNE